MSLNPTMVTTSENALYLFLTVFGLVRLPHAHSHYHYVSVLFFYYYVGGYVEHCAIIPE